MTSVTWLSWQSFPACFLVTPDPLSVSVSPAVSAPSGLRYQAPLSAPVHSVFQSPFWGTGCDGLVQISGGNPQSSHPQGVAVHAHSGCFTGSSLGLSKKKSFVVQKIPRNFSFPSPAEGVGSEDKRLFWGSEGV